MFPLKLAFKKICASCHIEFTGRAANAKFCLDCKQLGHHKICTICSMKFRSKYTATKYCSNCSKLKLFQVGVLRSDACKEKISNSRTRWAATSAGIDFYKKLGTFNSNNLKRYFKTDIGKAQITRVSKNQSKTMRSKILNGTFSPNITNSWTHWSAIVVVDDIEYKFRSSWEACFWISNKHMVYETIRVKSIRHATDKSYIADFYDPTTNILYEIKPKSEYLKRADKMDSLQKYCKTNGIKFKWINESNILSYIDTAKFTTVSEQLQLNKLLTGIQNETSKTKHKKYKKIR